MKTKPISKKLNLTKITVSNLDINEAKKIYGGELKPFEPVESVILLYTCNVACLTVTGNPCLAC